MSSFDRPDQLQNQPAQPPAAPAWKEISLFQKPREIYRLFDKMENLKVFPGSIHFGSRSTPEVNLEQKVTRLSEGPQEGEVRQFKFEGIVTVAPRLGQRRDIHFEVTARLDAEGDEQVLVSLAEPLSTTESVFFDGYPMFELKPGQTSIMHSNENFNPDVTAKRAARAPGAPSLINDVQFPGDPDYKGPEKPEKKSVLGRISKKLFGV